MKKNVISLSLVALSLSFAGLDVAHAQTPTPQKSYQEALAECENISDTARRANCERDVHAAYHHKDRKHTSPDMRMLEQNRVARCHRLPEPQRQHCIEAMQGQHHTKTHGSVEGGGILRQTTIEIPGEPYEVTRPIKETNNTAVSPSSERVITPIN